MASDSSAEVWNDKEQEVAKLVKIVYEKLQSNWEELYGIHSEHVQERSRAFFEKLKEYCSNMEQESEEEKNKMITNIEDLLRENNRYSKELNIENDLDFGDKTPLSEVYHKLYSIVSNLKKIKRERVAEYKLLKDMENELCAILEVTPIKAVTGIASAEQMRSLEIHIQDLESKKVHLVNAIKTLRTKIASLLHDLGVMPLLTIEKFCIDGNESLLMFNKNTFSELEKLLEKMETQRLSAIEEADQLRCKLSVLWERVEVTFDVRESVLMSCKGHSKDEILKLKEEVNRCENLKRKNLKVYIDKVKEELLNWWDRCCMSDHQKTSFRPFYETHHSEEVLSLLELELERTKDFYKRNEIIFDLAERRQAMWEKFRKLEASTKDTNRLFNNRGGALLREEKERKKIQKDLPKIEAKLAQQLNVYEERENKVFLLNGVDLREEMERHWLEWQFKKDIEKNARKVANVKTLVMESKLGTLQLQQHGQQQGLKRKLATPLARNNEHLEDLSKVSNTPCRSTLTSGPRVLRPRNAPTPFHSSPKTPKLNPYSRNMAKTLKKSPFKVGSASSSRIPTVVVPTKSPRPLTQLKTPRRQLPIII